MVHVGQVFIDRIERVDEFADDVPGQSFGAWIAREDDANQVTG